LPELSAGLMWFEQYGTNAFTLEVVESASASPEPGTLAVVGLAALVLARFRRAKAGSVRFR
jgi:MYXO-CTERM domain-containing protein